MMAIPALFPFLPEFFGLGYLELGFGVTIFMMVTLFLQVPAGFVVDRYGAKRLLGLGMIISALAFFSLAIFPSYFWFIVVMAVLGVVNTVYHPADFSLLTASSPPARLGRAYSYHTFSGNLGTAMTPALMYFSALLGGVPLAFAVAGLLPLIASYLLDPVHTSRGKGKYYLFDHVIFPLKTTDRKGLSDDEWRKQRINLALQIGIMTLFFTLVVLSMRPFEQFGQTALIMGSNFSELDATTLITVMLFTNAFGVLLGGRIADATSRHGLVAILGYLLAAVLTFFITVVSLSFVPLLIVLMLIGFMVGMIAPSRDMMVKKISPPGTEGRIFATVSLGYHIGGAIVPIFMGWFLDNGLPDWVLLFAALSMVGVVVIALIQELFLVPKRYQSTADGSLKQAV